MRPTYGHGRSRQIVDCRIRREARYATRVPGMFLGLRFRVIQDWRTPIFRGVRSPNASDCAAAIGFTREGRTCEPYAPSRSRRLWGENRGIGPGLAGRLRSMALDEQIGHETRPRTRLAGRAGARVRQGDEPSHLEEGRNGRRTRVRHAANGYAPCLGPPALFPRAAGLAVGIAPRIPSHRSEAGASHHAQLHAIPALNHTGGL